MSLNISSIPDFNIICLSLNSRYDFILEIGNWQIKCLSSIFKFLTDEISDLFTLNCLNFELLKCINKSQESKERHNIAIDIFYDYRTHKSLTGKLTLENIGK